MKNLNKVKLILTSFLCGTILSSASFAGNRQGIHPLLSDDFSGNLGLFYANTKSILSANGTASSDIGDDIDFENDLGIADTGAVFIGSFKWRFTEKFHTSFEFLTIDRDSTATLNKDVSWGDLDFSAGANVKGSLGVDIYRLFIGYSFVQSKQLEVGAGIGLHFMDLEASLSGDAIVNGVSVAAASESEEFLAPLPNIGGYISYAFSPKLITSGRIDWFSASIGDYDGSLTSVAAEIQYQAFKNIGFGAGYHYLDVDVNVKTNGWTGGANYSYHGPKLFMTYNF